MIDHLAKSAEGSVIEKLNAHRPDVVVIHYIHGLGYRLIGSIAKAGYPIVYVAHDLALICYRMMMFKDDSRCASHCFTCQLSTALKAGIVHGADRATAFGIISPSASNLDVLKTYFPVDRYDHEVIFNIKEYAAARTEREPGDGRLRLLFAGKIHPSKGIAVLLEAVEHCAEVERIDLSIRIAGEGPIVSLGVV